MGDTDDMKMTGLILAQSALVGIAVGVFSSGLWLPAGDDGKSWQSGTTYAMAALAVQTIAYYLFKMFFEQQMRERVRMTNIERQRTSKYRNMQQSFDHRRAEMEIRLQEAQLERELRWMEANPGKMPPSWGVQGGGPSIIGAFDAKQNERFDGSRIPTHEAESQTPVNLGIKDDVPLTKDGKPDKRYAKKSE